MMLGSNTGECELGFSLAGRDQIYSVSSF